MFLRNLRIVMYPGNCALPGYYAASGGNFLPTFKDKLWIPSSGVCWILEPWTWDRHVVPKRP